MESDHPAKIAGRPRRRKARPGRAPTAPDVRWPYRALL
jgi:hypothetical protein